MQSSMMELETRALFFGWTQLIAGVLFLCWSAFGMIVNCSGNYTEILDAIVQKHCSGL